ncbi:hypothetical protein MPSEU_000614400 [Mayamaea pseudoterrestris]|nr:hypothetical protein MPSEU_000614400 [Mayamaea pseudoterrestris]
MNGSSMSDSSSFLIDPALLKGLTDEQKQEALQAAAAAQRAEERAEQRAMEQAFRRKEEERRRLDKATAAAMLNHPDNGSNKQSTADGVVYIPKRKRGLVVPDQPESVDVSSNLPAASNAALKSQSAPIQQKQNEVSSAFSEKEMARIRETYLGKSAVDSDVPEEPKKKKTFSKKQTFKFQWDDTDDTYQQDDLLYSGMATVANQKKPAHKKQEDIVTTIASVQVKPLHKMTPRDWRIVRENYEINVKGGKCPPPLRSFRENPAPNDIPDLHPALLDAIEYELRFKEPSPIQRQAIPIGLQRRDLIGIAETGSGKTLAFGVPLCHYILNLPMDVLKNVHQSGPLAVVLAPTRELAIQIDVEIGRLLSRQDLVKTCCIVGGQPIQQQAVVLREGRHVLVGTPGRILDCLEMAYLVLNQCSYVCLDESDRMVDMGFEPQIRGILDAIGGVLKSEDEKETYRQEIEDLQNKSVARHRVTAMFSATMPLEVEKIAKQYLRHPAIISVGDRDSGKNARITQKIVFLSSPAQKEKALTDLICDPRFLRDKILVFVNEKKHADGVGRIVERAGRQCVVLHGGKSQEEREENLERFRRGGIVMVATDVAGRGLDIPDVAHVINYDLPTRSIENYTHRIGRTGRAGKTGLATSFITEADQGIMAPLRKYLESTGNQVPDRLAKHPAAHLGVQSNLID